MTSAIDKYEEGLEKQEPILFHVSEEQAKALDTLVSSGDYGRNRAEVMKRIFSEFFTKAPQEGNGLSWEKNQPDDLSAEPEPPEPNLLKEGEEGKALKGDKHE